MPAGQLIAVIGVIADIVKSLARYSKELKEEGLLASEEIQHELKRIHELSGFLLEKVHDNDKEIDKQIEESNS